MSTKRIISTELLKLPRLGNYILLSLLLLLYTGFTLLYFYQFGLMEGNASFGDIGAQLLSTEVGIAGLLIAIFIIMNVGKEYSDGTLRKNIIDGYTRDDFFSGKLSILLLCVLGSFILGLITLVIVGLALGELDGVMDLMNSSFLINFFIKILYKGLFALFLIFLFRKIAFSIVAYFLWSTFEGLISGIQHVFIMMNGGGEPSFLIAEFLPLSSLDYVVTTSEIVSIQAIVVSSFYVLLMLILPYYFYLKADIKS